MITGIIIFSQTKNVKRPPQYHVKVRMMRKSFDFVLSSDCHSFNYIPGNSDLYADISRNTLIALLDKGDGEETVSLSLVVN
jgi:hypothetical protein